MDNTFKTVQTFAISIPIVLYSDIAQSQSLLDVDLKHNSRKSVNFQTNAVADLTEPNLLPISSSQEQENNETSLITQSKVDSSSNLQNLNPDANLLQLPKVPQAVKVIINRSITLEQAIQLMIANNQTLQEARLNLERSQQELKEAKAARYPTLDTQFDVTEFDDSSAELGIEQQIEAASGQGISETDIESSIDDDTSIGFFTGSATLTYNLYTGGLIGADIQRAEKQVSFDKLVLEQAKFEARFETIRDYYSLQNADSQVEIDQAAVDDATQTLNDALLLKQAGIGTEFDVLRAKVELANVKQVLVVTQSEQKIARRQLIATLDLGQQVELKTADKIERAGDWNFSLEKTIVMAYGNRAELQQLLVSREINEKQKQIALSSIRPQASLSANYDVLDVFSDGVGLTDGYTLNAQISWRLFDGGAAKASAKQSETDIRINEVQFANQRNEIRLEVEQGYYALDANEENIETASTALKLAQDSLALARLRFQAGEGTQTDVIESQSELTTARANYIQAIINYNQSLNQLERAVTNLPVTN